MQFRAGFDPQAFVARGLAARRRLEDFGRATDDGGGYDGVVQPEWVDYATVAIGLYAGAAGLTPDEILRIQNGFGFSGLSL